MNFQKSQLEPKQVFEFVGYQYDLLHRLVKPTQNHWESILQKVESILSTLTCLVRKFMSLIGLLTAMEKQKTLEGSRITGTGDSSSKDSPPTPEMVDPRDECLARSTSAPSASCHSNLYRRLKRRLGCTLRQLHRKRHLVSARKTTTYKFLGTKDCLAGTKKVPVHSTRESRSDCYGQHYSCGIHKQGGRYEVRLSLCPSMATPVLVQSETCCPEAQTHPRSSECDCRQLVSTRPNNSDGMVSSSGGV